MGSKVTEILLPDPFVAPKKSTVIVESPSIHKKRFIGIESFDDGGAPPAVFEGNPCHLTVINEDPSEDSLVLNYRLILKGTPGFPDGIEIHRATNTASENGGFDLLPRGLCMEPGETVELEVLASDGGEGEGEIPTDARSVKIVASYCDFPGEIVRTSRVLLTDELEDAIPAPPLGSQNSPISRSNGIPEFSFLAAQPGGAAPLSANVTIVLDSDGTIAYLGNPQVPAPDQSPNVDGTLHIEHAGITLGQKMSVRAQNATPDDVPVVALMTWMEISAPST
jgi:hypothetical protein